MAVRSYKVRPSPHGVSLSQSLMKEFKLSRPGVSHLLRHKKVSVDGKVCRDPERKIRSGQTVAVTFPDNLQRRDRKQGDRFANMPARQAPPKAEATVPAGTTIRFADDHVLVVEKPAGLTTVRHAHEVEEAGEKARRFLPPTLVDVLPKLLRKKTRLAGKRIRAVHRIERETSGLVVLALSAAAESALGKLFRAHEVGRAYVALVRGKAEDARVESLLVRDRGDGRRGSTPDIGPDAKRAVTNVRVLESFSDARLGDISLVECRLETGRTHQVRIHLGEKGTPLCGERIYDRPLKGRPTPDGSGATRPLLHAASLAFVHPVTGERLAFESKLPEDMFDLLQRLRRRNSAPRRPRGDEK